MQRQEIADMIGVHVETIKVWESNPDRTPKGWPAPLRIGDKIVLYEREDIDRFLREARSEQPIKPAQTAEVHE